MRRASALLGAVLVLLALAACHSAAKSSDVVESIRSKSLFFETFDGDDWQDRWKHSTAAKYNGRFIRAAGKDWTDTGLKIPEKSKYYGLAALLDAPVPIVSSEPDSDSDLPLIIQYEVKYEQGVSCGGAYLKLLSAEQGMTAEGLVDNTPYSIMFGPDKCGGPGKVHLIFRYRSPVNGSIEEKHLVSPPAPETDDYTHLYTLKLFPNHEYEISVDGIAKSSGRLLDEGKLAPPLTPPREVLDPEDKKPADWVDVSV
ncbi:hypothetical protein GPECTOR_6g683 [Gonium pectorale]|uniref:Calreticulin n=1 Tax=Gonium pectorale TaxID=33097 RepID=A0A150GVA5_GONPE|nr:hypothetical protein GPECTOR_6g683 [Gonium pectorale]|eukprot:KXZ53765.1 hypothetical protein GPECTOR_6g683 [Gonium pectorale]